MTVYVLTVVWQRDSGDCGNEVIGVYQDFELAQRLFKNEMKNAKKDLEDLDTEEDNYIDGDMSWSIWEEGEYCYNHIDIQITECEVK